MNCSDFQEIMLNLVRHEQPGGEHFSHEALQQREDALAHARVCAGCDEALAEAASLTSELRALAGSYARAETPARVEKALLAAYRQNCAAAKPMQTRWRVPVAVTGLAMAASLVMAIFLYHPEKHAIFSRAIAPAAIPLPAPAPAKQNPNKTAQNSAARDQSAQTLPAPSSRPPVNMASGNRPHNSLNVNSFEDISATSGTFMPLPYADENPIENATVVRATLPRTALGAFGLPVADGAAEGKVVADFIVGEDGTPEAIRIVR